MLTMGQHFCHPTLSQIESPKTNDEHNQSQPGYYEFPSNSSHPRGSIAKDQASEDNEEINSEYILWLKGKDHELFQEGGVWRKWFRDQETYNEVTDPQTIAEHKNFIEYEHEKETKDAFCMFDIKKQKYLDFDVLKTIMKKIGENLSDDDIREILTEADKDKDGKIDYQEFKSIMNAM